MMNTSLLASFRKTNKMHIWQFLKDNFDNFPYKTCVVSSHGLFTLLRGCLIINESTS